MKKLFVIAILVIAASCSKSAMELEMERLKERAELQSQRPIPSYIRVVSEDHDGKVMVSNVIKIK